MRSIMVDLLLLMIWLAVLSAVFAIGAALDWLINGNPFKARKR